jgi:hypothetical protein
MIVALAHSEGLGRAEDRSLGVAAGVVDRTTTLYTRAERRPEAVSRGVRRAVNNRRRERSLGKRQIVLR